jgi:hypothetical protein
MKGAARRSMMLALRAWLDEDDSDRNARRIAEYVVEKTLAGHVGFVKLLLDMVDGKLHQTAETEGTFEADWVLVVADDGRDAETAKAA